MFRKQFTFYESFLTAVSKIRKESERCKAYEAIMHYALYGTEPEDLPDRAAITFEMARPVLDTGWKRAQSGQKGGRRSSVPEPFD